MSSVASYTILIIHNKYRFAGGEDTVVCNEKKLLEKYGHKVILWQQDNTSIKQHVLFQKLFLPLRTIFSLSSYRQVKRIIKEQQADIVHVHNTLPLVSFSVYYAAKKYGCGLVQTLHNFRFLCPNGLFYRDGHICEDCTAGLSHSVKHACYRGSVLQSAAVALNLWLHRKIGTFNLPDVYIALTEFNKEKLSRILNPDKIYIKPNFNPQSTPFTMPKLRRGFLCLSRLEDSKGIMKLLESFRNMPDVGLDIVGTGTLESQVRDYIDTNHLSKIILYGQISHDKAMELLYHAKALLLPTQLYEGFPMTIAESYSLGTPVIGSNIGNTADLIENGKTGFVYNTDEPGALQSIINRFCKDEFDYKAMESNCQKVFSEKYSEDINYHILLNIYSRALSQR